MPHLIHSNTECDVLNRFTHYYTFVSYFMVCFILRISSPCFFFSLSRLHCFWSSQTYRQIAAYQKKLNNLAYRSSTNSINKTHCFIDIALIPAKCLGQYWRQTINRLIFHRISKQQNYTLFRVNATQVEGKHKHNYWISLTNNKRFNTLRSRAHTKTLNSKSQQQQRKNEQHRTKNIYPELSSLQKQIDRINFGSRFTGSTRTPFIFFVSSMPETNEQTE